MLTKHSLCLLVLLTLGAAGVAADDASYLVRMQAMPGASKAGIGMDYIGYDPATHSVWVPAGNTGAVVVIDARQGTTRTIGNLPTATMGNGERKRVVGPSSVTIGEGAVYIGNRGDSSVCSYDPATLAPRKCHVLDSMPDGLCAVPAQKEVWVTTPRDKSIRRVSPSMPSAGASTRISRTRT
jgi:hypothetical protein